MRLLLVVASLTLLCRPAPVAHPRQLPVFGHCETRQNDPREPALFARPEDGPQDPHITVGAASARIPIAFDGEHILLQGRLNGSAPVWLALDSGASVSLLDIDFARSQGLSLRGRPSIRGVVGTALGFYAPRVSFTIGEAELSNQAFRVLPLGFLPPMDGQPVVGILGFEVFARFVVEIDYQALHIHLHEPRSYRYEGPGAIIPLTLHANQPYIRARLGILGRPELEGEYVVDLGSGNTLMLASDYAAAHRVQSALQKTLQLQAEGVGGEFQVTLGRLQSLRVGPFTVAEPLALFPPGRVTAPGKAGNIGGRFLSRFRVTIDYCRERLILEPTAKLAEPEEFDMSGLQLAATSPPSNHIRITRILGDSPSAEAGIQAGDFLLKAEGRPAARIPLNQLREMFRRGEGHRIDLEIQTGDETRLAQIKLRRLL